MPNATDTTEARLESNGRALLPDPSIGETLWDWWLTHRNPNTPSWDLAVSCKVRGKRGLVLVEAKDHEGELDWGPKSLDKTASVESKQNHQSIGEAIEQARAALDGLLPGTVAISRDRHYQLSNRMAYAWKLASLGIPVVLVYLGFVGDTYFRNDYFHDADHWQRVMGGYMRGLLPLSLPGTSVQCGKDEADTFMLTVWSQDIVAKSR